MASYSPLPASPIRRIMCSSQPPARIMTRLTTQMQVLAEGQTRRRPFPLEGPPATMLLAKLLLQTLPSAGKPTQPTRTCSPERLCRCRGCGLRCSYHRSRKWNFSGLPCPSRTILRTRAAWSCRELTSPTQAHSIATFSAAPAPKWATTTVLALRLAVMASVVHPRTPRIGG